MQSKVKRPTYHYWKKKWKESTHSKNVQEEPLVKEMVFAKVLETPGIIKEETSLSLEWNELKVTISNPQEAVLAAILIKELRAIC